jgi:hypothetical protein
MSFATSLDDGSARKKHLLTFKSENEYAASQWAIRHDTHAIMGRHGQLLDLDRAIDSTCTNRVDYDPRALSRYSSTNCVGKREARKSGTVRAVIEYSGPNIEHFRCGSKEQGFPTLRRETSVIRFA